MKGTHDPFILDTDTAAAKYVTDIKGWVSRHGHFFGDGPSAEQVARYDGCTHRACDTCGAPAQKHYTNCNVCRSKADAERHAAREKKPWDGVCLIYSNSADKWFHEVDEIVEYCEEHDVTPESLLLVLSEPVYARSIDPVEHYVDDLPEESDEGDLPAVLQEAFEALNKAIEGCEVPLSWKGGKYALDLECLPQQSAQPGGEA